MTDAVSIVSKSGGYGGTYIHNNIAMFFAIWISLEFQLYIMKDYRRLKTDENSYLSLSWSLNREISKLNVVLFGKTAKWRKDENRTLRGNMRDVAIWNQLLGLTNLESYNAVLINQGKIEIADGITSRVSSIAIAGIESSKFK